METNGRVGLLEEDGTGMNQGVSPYSDVDADSRPPLVGSQGGA